MSGENKLYTMDGYLGVRRRNIIIIVITSILCIVVAYLSMGVNDNHMSVADVTRTIINHINHVPFKDYREELEDYFVFDFFIPRAIGCITVGAILSVGGAMMQTVIKNPLADPYTIGLSSGALVGVSINVIFGVGFGLSRAMNMMVMAFIFSMLPCAVIIFFTFFKKATSNIIILIGIAVSYIFSASSTMILFAGTTIEYEEIYRWTLGSLNNIDKNSWMVLIPSTIIMLILVICMSKLLNITSVDDKLATSLGVNSSRVRMFCLVIVSLFTATTVSYVGTIGFVGLIIPNIARRLVSSDSKILIPFSAILGGLFMILCDCIARSVKLGGIQVGIVTAFIGAPAMLFILIKMKKNAWR